MQFQGAHPKKGETGWQCILRIVLGGHDVPPSCFLYPVAWSSILSWVPQLLFFFFIVRLNWIYWEQGEEERERRKEGGGKGEEREGGERRRRDASTSEPTFICSFICVKCTLGGPGDSSPIAGVGPVCTLVQGGFFWEGVELIFG